MNTRYKNTPEVIGTVRVIDENGDDRYYGDKVVGVQVMHNKTDVAGLVQIDVRDLRVDLKNGENFILEIELPELVLAIAQATLNAEKN